MGQSNINLAALIGSRICHDLISPIGAITNGLELLDLAGSIQGPELDLITDSVGNAGARIRFFRVAYGAAGEQLLGRPEIVSVLEDLNRGGRHTVQWTPSEAQPRSLVRLAFLALQCCETAMPYGGLIRVMAEDGVWTVTGNADKLVLDDALWHGLAHPEDMPEITSAQVQFALLPGLAEDLGRKVETARQTGQFSIRF